MDNVCNRCLFSIPSKVGMGFQFEQPTAGIWKEKKQFAGKRDQDPPSGPSVEKQKQQMIKLRNLSGAEKFFFLSQDEQIG